MKLIFNSQMYARRRIPILVHRNGHMLGVFHLTQFDNYPLLHARCLRCDCDLVLKHASGRKWLTSSKMFDPDFFCELKEANIKEKARIIGRREAIKEMTPNKKLDALSKI